MKRTTRYVFAGLLVLSLVLSACAPAATATQAPAATQPAAAATQPPAAQPTDPPQPTDVPVAAPKTLTIASGTDIENTNIHLVTSSPSFSVLEHIYEPLFSMSKEGVLEPLLAESIESTGEGIYEIKLRQGISFTDGTPFNAEAVKANLDWVLDPENTAPFRGTLLGKVTEVSVVDEFTVQIATNGPFAPLPAHLSHGAVAMVSPRALEQGIEYLAENAIGTGPYLLKSWARDEAVTLERNPNYWGEASKIDTVVFKVIKEDGARIVEIEAGTIDIAVRVPPAEIERLQANPNIDVVITPGLRTIYIFFNVTEAPFDDVRVRQAVNYAVDKEALVRDLFSNAALVSSAPFAPPIFGYAEQEFYKRDVEKAKALLAEAGVAQGTKVVLYHPTGRYIQDALVADAVRAQLREIGLDVELRTLEWPQYVPHVRKTKADGNDVQFAMLGWGTPTMDADYALFALFHSTEHPPGFNGAFYNNPEVDALLDEARSTLDATARLEAYKKAIQIIWEDAPWLFLYSEVQATAIRKGVTGFIVHPDESLIAQFADKE
jgi:peptide/nickel transport system substrate-binding protein